MPEKTWRRVVIGVLWALPSMILAVVWWALRVAQGILGISAIPDDWLQTQSLLGVDVAIGDLVVLGATASVFFAPLAWKRLRQRLRSTLPVEADSPPVVDPEPAPSESGSPPKPEPASAPPPEPEEAVEIKINCEPSQLSLYGLQSWILYLYVSVRCLRPESAFIRSSSLESGYGEWRPLSDCPTELDPLDLDQEFRSAKKVEGLMAFECQVVAHESIFDHQLVLAIKVVGEPDYKFSLQPVRSDIPNAIDHFVKEV